MTARSTSRLMKMLKRENWVNSVNQSQAEQEVNVDETTTNQNVHRLAAVVQPPIGSNWFLPTPIQFSSPSLAFRIETNNQVCGFNLTL